ncbi:MAG: ribosome biogenesis GTPase Der [Alphaproteobacteria bacterium]|nr:ribosome biogenesis GTPase Der [Alphaproteobacteria bacterium]
MAFTLAILGRPNVGKSTLFNRLTGKRMAIVDDRPGVTRDWRLADAQLYDLSFQVVDTAGLEEAFDDSIPARMRQQTQAALQKANAVLFVIDGRAGITPTDAHFADWLRKQKKPIILAANKSENEKAVQSALGEAYSLGLGDPIPISAAHGTGMEDIYYRLRDLMPAPAASSTTQEDEAASKATLENDVTLDAIEGIEDYEFEQEEEEEKSLKIAIIGRPNVGKSTLLNAILGEERVITGPEAGLTRDAIAVDWEFEDQRFRLVDTAGMRRKARVQDAIEKMAVEDSLRAIRLAHVAILVLDAQSPLDKQDLQIASHVVEEGRALILAVNKWDAATDKQGVKDLINRRVEQSLAQLKDVPIVPISALNGKNIPQLLKQVMDIYAQWNIRIKTSGLNRWLGRMESQNPAPLVGGRPNRLKYITQIKARPPTFALWLTHPEKLPDSHKRFLINGLRRDYDIGGVPVRLLLRKTKNPFI